MCAALPRAAASAEKRTCEALAREGLHPLQLAALVNEAFT